LLCDGLVDQVAGYSDLHPFMRGGETVRASKRHIKQGVEASLKRLQTDYIDLLYVCG
jgi:aryl-alcohol dehydrogenase-like predicted oxidoreductase